MDWSSLGIAPDIITVLESKKLSPLPIQAQAIPALLGGTSATLVSRTGSGKTLAYLLPIITRIKPEVPGVQAVVLAPTHELAMQIYRVATDLVREAGLSVRTQALIGGAASARQIDGLKKKPQLVVGSAGRLVHLLDLGKLKLRDTSWLVFDEADRLLIDEAMEHIRRITGEVGPETHFLFVSATEGAASARFAKSIAPNLAVLKVQEERISPAIRHMYLNCDERDKFDLVRKAVRSLNPTRTLVFVHRGSSAERIAERLEYHQLAVADLHGARDKFARQAALEAFRKGIATVLIASDIAARGLDISGVELVINVDAPSQSRDYLHRAGRTGRAGAKGVVLTLLNEQEIRLARRYAEELDIELEHVRIVRGAVLAADDKAPDEGETRRSARKHGGFRKTGLGKTSPRADRSGIKPLTGSGESRSSKDPQQKPRDRDGAARPDARGTADTSGRPKDRPHAGASGSGKPERRPLAAGATRPPRKKDRNS